jgi:hypothetical protein
MPEPVGLVDAVFPGGKKDVVEESREKREFHGI